MNVISYSFFEPRKYNDDKFYDKYISRDRYWYNIPALIIMNNILYPDFVTKFYISRSILNNPLYEIIQKSNEFNKKVEVEIMDYDYSYTEPTIWRYKHIINSDVDILLCRDIDSVPNSDEYLATKYFIENDNFKITSIRSNKHHNCGGTIMLAGLCGFRTKEIQKLYDNFDNFYEQIGKDNWGIDQRFVINTLLKNSKEWIHSHFLDSKLSNIDNIVTNSLLQCVSLDNNWYKNNVKSDVDKILLDFIDKHTIWAGEPVNFRGDVLRELFSFSGYSVIDDVKNIIYGNDILKKFYLD